MIIFFVTHGSCLRETFRFLCCWERGKKTQLSLPTTRRLGVLEQQRSTYCAKTSAKILSLFCMCIHHASLLSSSTRRDFERCLFCFRCITRRVAELQTHISCTIHVSWESALAGILWACSSCILVPAWETTRRGMRLKRASANAPLRSLTFELLGCEFRIHDLAGVLLPSKSGQPICLTYPLKSSKDSKAC